VAKAQPTPLPELAHSLRWTQGKKFRTIHIAGPQALAEIHSVLAGAPGGYDDPSPPGWVYGPGGSTEAFARTLAQGDRESAEEAEALSRRLDSEVCVGQTMPTPVPTVAGGGLCVPAALGGSPLAFTRQEWVQSNFTPVRIFAPIGALAAVDAPELRQRGLAVLALARAVSTVRPVSLEAYAGEEVNYDRSGVRPDPVVVRIPIGTTPVDWAMAGAIFGQPGMFRDLIFRLSFWGSGVGSANATSDVRYRHTPEALCATDNDVVLTRDTMTEVDGNDPIAWVQAQIDKYNLKAE